MSVQNVEDAISAHLVWVEEFRAALRLEGTQDFDMDRAADPSACRLGRWLSSDAARSLLGPGKFAEISRLHEGFHDSAFVIASLFAQRTRLQDIQPFFLDFEKASERLVGLLRESITA